MPSASFKDDLLAETRNLRAFAISLSGSVTLADDLVQESLLRAWSNSEKFQPGTSLRAWLFTILRNIYYSNYRKRAREVQDSDGLYARRLTVPGDQESHLDLEDFRNALTMLPAEQREVLTLIGASGLSYEEAAVICEVGIGTIKSRLSRARSKLVELLKLDETSNLAGRAQSSAHRLASLSREEHASEQRFTADTRTRGEAGFSTIGQSAPLARLGSRLDFPVWRTNGTPRLASRRATGDAVSSPRLKSSTATAKSSAFVRAIASSRVRQRPRTMAPASTRVSSRSIAISGSSSTTSTLTPLSGTLSFVDRTICDVPQRLTPHRPSGPATST